MDLGLGLLPGSNNDRLCLRLVLLPGFDFGLSGLGFEIKRFMSLAGLRLELQPGHMDGQGEKWHPHAGGSLTLTLTLIGVKHGIPMWVHSSGQALEGHG